MTVKMGFGFQVFKSNVSKSQRCVESCMSSVFTEKCQGRRSRSFLPSPKIKRRVFQRCEPLLGTHFADF